MTLAMRRVALLSPFLFEASCPLLHEKGAAPNKAFPDVRNEKEIEIAASLGPRRKRCSGFSASGDDDNDDDDDDDDDVKMMM